MRTNDDTAGYPPPVHRLAEVLAVLLYAHRLPPRMNQRVIWGVEAGLGGAAGSVFAGHGGSSAGVVDPLHGNGDSFMLLFLWVTRSITLLEAGYVCARAFILAELAASVEWQLHCVLWPQRGGAEPLSLLLLGGGVRRHFCRDAVCGEPRPGRPGS